MFGGNKMNGLKYVRTRCNLSVNDLAEYLGVTRQAVCSWENGKKELPVLRQEQLSVFFGIDKKYFGEITETDKKYLIEKAMFCHNEKGKESFRYKPQEGVTDIRGELVYFLEDNDISLNEEFDRAKKKQQQTIMRIENIIRGNYDSMQNQMMSMGRGCRIYDMINDSMEAMEKEKGFLKIPFYYELINVLEAMCLAYGLIEEDDLSDNNSTEPHRGKDEKWIEQLSQQIKEHWDEERLFQETYHEKITKKTRKRNDVEDKKEESLEKQILKIEEHNRRFREEHPESDSSYGCMVYCEQ